MGGVDESSVAASRDDALWQAEARGPMVGAMLPAIGLTVLLPDELRVGPPWLLPAIEFVLLVAIVAGDGQRIDRRDTFLRVLSIGLVALLVFEALWSTAWLIHALIVGKKVTDSASDLLV